jgi:DNA-binding transcriptional MerR regulator
VVGITYRQLDYWARTELVTPSVREAGGSGTQRLYSFQDLVQLRIIKQLLETGISLQHVRKAIEYLRTLDRPVQSMTLISDGRRVYTPESPEAVIDLLSQGQGVFAIALGKVEDDLSRRLNAEPAGRKRALAGAGGA